MPIEDIGGHLQRGELLYLVIGAFAAVITHDMLGGGKKKAKAQELGTAEEGVQEAKSGFRREAIMKEAQEKADQFVAHMNVNEARMRANQLRSWTAYVKNEIKELVDDPDGYLRRRNGVVPTWVAVISTLMLIVFEIAIFSILVPGSVLDPLDLTYVPWELFLFGPPIALLSAYFTAKAISETGLLAGYISDVVSSLAVLIFRVTFVPITRFESMIGSFQDAAMAALVHLSLGRLTGVRGRDIIKAVFIGLMLGTIVGSYFIFFIYKDMGGFGGSDFPSPTAQLFAILITSLSGQLPGMNLFPGVHPVLVFLYLMAYAVIGFFVSRELEKRKLSGMSFAVGLLVPAATAVTIAVGGFIDYWVGKEPRPAADEPIAHEEVSSLRYEKTNRFLSGIVAGEAIVTVGFVFFTGLLHII
jgi:uncharacterized oligopeptide transporter (OPT) family protein